MRSTVAKHMRDAVFPLDCENCYINTGQPIEDNELILDLYEQLPFVFDINGIRIISAADMKFIFELFEISRDIWDDLYQRIMYYNNIITDTELKMQKKEAEKQKSLAKPASRQGAQPVKR